MKDQEQQSDKEREIEANLKQLNYPANEDIFNQEDKASNINPEKITNDQVIDQKEGEWNENSFNIDKEEKLGDDLDVPGADLDDQQENIGSEDEENNYYSEGDTL
ncbi:hypothetical protein ACRASX_09395 [Flavobacterium sp. TMP13]|uniref:hypothetical protein n=1 Tax=unclassified Flavobacterium TaxID=196869 RepID=UPI00076D1E82|nr:hypothetical protein [Flavobacterium sp. TAB 87]KVV15312.1 hypothetical protein AP058_00975 [Flavobacterium sp. TAB 87]